jgi:hypothetical protein
VTTYSREDDPVVALQEATKAITAHGLFAEIVHFQGEGAATQTVLRLASAYVQWLRRLVSVRLDLVAIEEQDDPSIRHDLVGVAMTTFDTSQQARYVIDAVDDRGFPVDSTWTVSVSGPDASTVTAEVLEAESGTASGKDELVVVAVHPGSATVTITNTVDPSIFGSDAVDVIPGGVATVSLGAPTIEEQPTP